MWHLKDCELIRDGGSYAVTLADGTREISLWLQVERHADGTRGHGDLFFSRGSSAAPTFTDTAPVRRFDEGAWLDVLRSASTESVSPSTRDRLADLIEILAHRVPR